MRAVQAGAIYDAVAECDGFYDAPVAQGARSRMNVPFTIPSDKELEAKFLAEASDAGFVRPHSPPWIAHALAICFRTTCRCALSDVSIAFLGL